MPRFGPFTGVHNVLPAQQLPPEDLAAGVNIDLGDGGRVFRRHGRASFSAGAADSLFAYRGLALFRRSDALRRLLPGGSSEVLQSGVTQPVAYWGTGERIYWSDGLTKGVIVDGANEPWGISVPTTLPAYAAVATGNVPLGAYLYAVTYLRDGLESGAGPAGQTAEIQGAIAFTDIPVPADATEKAIYLSRPNGQDLYRAMVLPAATTSATYSGDTTGLSVRLETQFQQPPPPASSIAEHNGRMLLGVDRFLLYSSAYRHDLFDPIRMAYTFDAPVTLVAPVQGGVYVGTERAVEWLAGDDIATAARDVKVGYGAIPGTLALLDDAARLGDRGSGRGVLFASQEGVCLGAQGGAFENLTTARYRYPAARTGAGVVRLEAGRDRLVVAMRTA